LAQELRLPFVHVYQSRLPGISVPILITRDSSTVALVLPIDTGAEYCFFERSIGEQLGPTIEDGNYRGVRTVNSRFDAYGHEVTISAFGIETVSTVYFYADPLIRRSVLGRRGWVDRVRLGLIDHDCELYLAAYND